MSDPLTFGAWMRQRRKRLDLTRERLAQRAHCSVIALKRIESGSLRPSRGLAALLADALGVPADEREAFVRFARAPDASAAASAFIRADASPAALAQQHGARSNLPRPLTAFVGREREVQMLCSLLRRQSVALVTLSGPPGAGKTRLSLAVAEQLKSDFADGAWFVPLAAIRDPSLVLNAIAAVLGVHESAQQSLLATTRAHLRDKELLLVLDNFEQVIAGVAIIGELLSEASGVKALVTSREVLRLYGEHEFPVPPLSLPDLKHLPSADALTTYSSIELFVARAQAARNDFALTRDNAESVARICAWLDGLPLAIEMAAARVKWSAPPDLLNQISRRLSLLSEGPRDLTPRQQTLRGAIEWSYELLADDERRAFDQLGVFEGGCTTHAAASVLSDGRGPVPPDGEPQPDPATVDTRERTWDTTLRSLVEKSLVAYDPAADEPRYQMLEMIREYAWERLGASGALAVARQRHAEYFLRLAEEAEPRLRGAEQIRWFDRLDAEYDNLRAALEWAWQSGSVDSGLRLSSALWYFWFVRGRLSEGLQLLQQALSLPGAQARNAPRARALHASGYTQWMLRRPEEARRALSEALSIARELDDRFLIATALCSLGHVAASEKEYQQAQAFLEEGLALWRRLANDHGIGWALLALGDLAFLQGDADGAQAAFLESAERLRLAGNRVLLAYPLRRLSYFALRRGEVERALLLCQESLRLNLETNEQRGIAACLAALAGISLARGQLRLAARLCGVLQKLSDSDATLLQADQAEFERTLAALRAQMEDAAFEQARAEGQRVTLDEAIGFVLAETEN